VSREKEPPRVVNFDDVGAKRRFMQGVQRLRGLHEVSIRPRKKTRSLNANSYYWSAFIHLGPNGYKSSTAIRR
jgi:hypothetical protein